MGYFHSISINGFVDSMWVWECVVVSQINLTRGVAFSYQHSALNEMNMDGHNGIKKV